MVTHKHKHGCYFTKWLLIRHFFWSIVKLFQGNYSVCWTFSFTLAESSALESSLLALAAGTASLLAAARDQLIAGLWRFLKCGSYSLDPTPTGWRRKHRVWSKCFPPDMTTLEGSSFNMLLQSSIWWNPLHGRSLRKELLPSLVHISAGAGTVIDKYDKPLNDKHTLFWYLNRCMCQFQQCISKLWEWIPCSPCCFLSMSNKCWHRVTPS